MSKRVLLPSIVVLSVFAWTLSLVCILASPVLAECNTKATICIAPLSNNTGEVQYNALGGAVADMLAVTLAEQKSITVVERQQLRKVLDEQKLTLAALIDPATAIRVGRLLKADHILVGGIIKQKNSFIVSIQAYEIATARLASTAQAKGKITDTVQIIDKLMKKLSKTLGIKLQPIGPEKVDKNPKASFHFAKGMGMFFAGNYDSAIVHFMKAQDLAPQLDKASYWMALCFMKNGEFKHALIELKTLLRRFPQSSLGPNVRKQITECKRHITTQPVSAPSSASVKKANDKK